MEFKKSEFTELQDMDSIKPSAAPLVDKDVQIAVAPPGAEAEGDFVPAGELWSWNPIDWYIGVRREIQEFSLEMTEKKRVVFKKFNDRCIALLRVKD
jgi:hypothetical protein